MEAFTIVRWQASAGNPYSLLWGYKVLQPQPPEHLPLVGSEDQPVACISAVQTDNILQWVRYPKKFSSTNACTYTPHMYCIMLKSNGCTMVDPHHTEPEWTTGQTQTRCLSMGSTWSEPASGAHNIPLESKDSLIHSAINMVHTFQNWVATCSADGRRNGSLSGFIIRRPSNSAAAQCHALTEDPSIPMMAWTARFSLDSYSQNQNRWTQQQDIIEKEEGIFEIKLSHVIFIYDCLDELKIRRSSSGAKLTIVSSALVMSSSSSVPIK